MENTARLGDLSPACKKLVMMMSELNYGRIEGLCLHRAEPLFDPAPRVIRERKLGGERETRPAPRNREFALKRAVEDLLQEFKLIGSGPIECIEVRQGLPVRIITKGSEAH